MKNTTAEKPAETGTCAKTDAAAENIAAAADIGRNVLPYAKIGGGSKNFVILPGLSLKPVSPMADSVAKLYAAFTDEYTVWLFDRPEQLHRGQTLGEMARDTALAMKQLGIAEADVFGASQGGMLAMFLAAEYPGLVRKLVLGSTASQLSPLFLERLAAWRKMTEEKDSRGLTESFVDWMYGEETVYVYRDVLLNDIPVYTDEELEHFTCLLDSFRAPELEKLPELIRCPVLVISCLGDRVTGPGSGVELAEKLKAQHYMYGAEYGHAVYDEAPDYTERIKRFLKERI